MKASYLIAGAIVLVALLAGIHWMMTKQRFDADVTATFARAAETYTYTQTDQTETEISGRLLRIDGIYRNDAHAGTYASIATTSISIPDEGVHVFSLENISVGDDVYTRVATESELLKAQIAFDSRWHAFRRDAIPAAYENIAISGPILDHLELFRSGSEFLDLVATGDDGERRTLTFRMRIGAKSNVGGTLATLLERIGDGHVTAWVNREHDIEQLVIDSENFHSTTTFSAFNQPLQFVVPDVAE